MRLRTCSSGLITITLIANQLRSGKIEVGLAIGVEGMSETYISSSRHALRRL
ncbi:hypothetical protein F5146DRAFT_1018915 [Armillaria mellea]|nr:hypothetical protein F5146DRAFT_1018915 [Armillaria mellea]